MLSRSAIGVHIGRRLAIGVRHLAAQKDDDDASTVIGTTSHIPAPQEHRPTVSPITRLGTDDFKGKEEAEEKGDEVTAEPITFLGSEERSETEERSERVITWIGRTKPEGLDEAIVKGQESRSAPQKTVRQPRPDLIRVEDLAFDLMPKSTRLLRPEKLTEPLDITEALEKLLVAPLHRLM